MKRIPCVLVALWLAATTVNGADSAPQKSTARADDLLLDALQGAWDMTGTVMGMPVHYHAEGSRVLRGGFLRLHMIDASSQPQYEASVYIGYDSKAGDYIAHWLDGFGAAGARVVGTGSRQDAERIVILYPYADGTFRNTFSWNAQSRSWALLIEAQQQSGKWSTFASYTLKPV